MMLRNIVILGLLFSLNACAKKFTQEATLLSENELAAYSVKYQVEYDSVCNYKGMIVDLDVVLKKGQIFGAQSLKGESVGYDNGMTLSYKEFPEHAAALEVSKSSESHSIYAIINPDGSFTLPNYHLLTRSNLQKDFDTRASCAGCFVLNCKLQGDAPLFKQL